MERLQCHANTSFNIINLIVLWGYIQKNGKKVIVEAEIQVGGTILYHGKLS